MRGNVRAQETITNHNHFWWLWNRYQCVKNVSIISFPFIRMLSTNFLVMFFVRWFCLRTATICLGKWKRHLWTIGHRKIASHIRSKRSLLLPCFECALFLFHWMFHGDLMLCAMLAFFNISKLMVISFWFRCSHFAFVSIRTLRFILCHSFNRRLLKYHFSAFGRPYEIGFEYLTR